MSRSKEEIKEEALRKLFVGGLSRDTTNDSFKDYFSQFGEVVDHIVIKDQGGFSKGFGFCTFGSDEAADDCIKRKADGHMIDGKSVEVKRAIPRDAEPDQREKNTKMFVGGLNRNTNEEQIKEYFESQFSCQVESVDLIYEKKDQVEEGREPQRRGFGFVTINDFDVVDQICVMRKHHIDGKEVEVKKAAPKGGPGGSGGGGGRGGGGRGRGGGRGYSQSGGYQGGGGGGYQQGGGYQGGGGGGYNQGGYGSQGGYNQSSGGYQQGGYAQQGGYGQAQGGYAQGGGYGAAQGGYQQGGYGGGYQNSSFSGPDKGGRGGRQNTRGSYKPY